MQEICCVAEGSEGTICGATKGSICVTVHYTSILNQIINRLENNSLITNPYDPCVSNKPVKGEAMTVLWNVDDLKLSHKEPFQVNNLFQDLLTINGNTLKVHRKNKNDYIGMYLYYSYIGVVNVLMIKYIQKVL